jgi:hypothetical protein
VLARESNRPREREVGGLGPVGIAGGFESEEVLAGSELVIDIGHTIAAGGRSKDVVVHRRQANGSLRIAIDAPASDGAATD